METLPSSEMPTTTKPSPPPFSLPSLFQLNPFWAQLVYFLFLPISGFLLLKCLPAKTAPKPKDLELLFMSVSASTVTGLNAVEMESFSESQLFVFILIMLLGGEVFTSLLGLWFFKIRKNKRRRTNLLQNSVRNLGFIVLGYLIAVHAGGFAFLRVYLAVFPASLRILNRKKLQPSVFAVFAVVSSFANCGLLPTNEGMVVFRESSGMLLAIAAVIAMGNTLYPCFLRLAVMGLKAMGCSPALEYLLRDEKEVGFGVLFPSRRTAMLAATAASMVAAQFVVFCCMEWWSDGMAGMSSFRKAVAALFMAVNSRHSGESVFDISSAAPAVLVLFVVMMYLPAHTTFYPFKEASKCSKSVEEHHQEEKKSKHYCYFKHVMFSQISCLAVFVMIICLTEKQQLSDDPLNFNVFNIIIEVISGYGNVGFSTGYSCSRQLKPVGFCKDSWISFSGRWSAKGKLALMAVMLYGRLKNFTMGAAKAWKLH
ncbi:putative cation transporter HKT6 [Apostasia shenzhenica]|uniref:Putative cation transporter HKT6 n=1 Tax=Apostasia shenzhenica TaxID=1088818 RepID=A0A2I0A544_9ASPA|nr:putative cation transporter HKT6 [Apostasia shenzhenica]